MKPNALLLVMVLALLWLFSAGLADSQSGVQARLAAITHTLFGAQLLLGALLLPPIENWRQAAAVAGQLIWLPWPLHALAWLGGAFGTEIWLRQQLWLLGLFALLLLGRRVISGPMAPVWRTPALQLAGLLGAMQIFSLASA